MINYQTQTALDNLIGQTIKRIDVSDKCIVFEIANSFELIIIGVEGDCCSESWFSDIYSADSIVCTSYLGKAVTSITEDPEHPLVKNYNLDDGRERQGCSQLYHFIVNCGDSQAVFMFRNCSNGYYGGWLYNVKPESVQYFLRDNFEDISNTKEWHSKVNNED